MVTVTVRYSNGVKRGVFKVELRRDGRRWKGEFMALGRKGRKEGRREGKEESQKSKSTAAAAVAVSTYLTTPRDRLTQVRRSSS